MAAEPTFESSFGTRGSGDSSVKKYGWICQRCGKSNSPDVKACDCKPKDKDNNDYLDKLKKFVDKYNYEKIEYVPVPYYPSIHPWYEWYPDWTYRPYPSSTSPYVVYMTTTTTGNSTGVCSTV